MAVTGASGRLGTVVCSVIEQLDGYELVAELSSSSTLSHVSADILVDVSHPDATEDIVIDAVGRGMRVLVGTSGWTSDRVARLRSAIATSSPDAVVVIVPNFSLGSVLGTALAVQAAQYFDTVEIVETHHANKVDAPSGTAIRTAERIADSRSGKSTPHAPTPDFEARGELVEGIPVHSLRLPGVHAKQEVIFSGDGETLTITHDTTSSDAYRAGIRAALLALPTLEGVTVGLDEVLGIRIGAQH